jgi:O-antigen ligase
VNSFLLISFIAICIINNTLTLYVGLTFLVTLTIFFKIKKNNFQKIILTLITFLVVLSLSIDKTAQAKVADILKIMPFRTLDILVKTTDIIDHNKKRSNAKKINLSMEIYKTSLIITKKALLHKPFGYGFNNYNEAFNQFIQNIDVYNWETRGLNTKDGSNTFVKIVVEFGIFSLFFFYFLISFFFNSKIDNRIKIFLILPILIQLCIRGVGYFNGGFLLFSFYALVLWLKANSRNNL